MTIRAYAAFEQGKPLEPFEYEPGELSADEVEIKVEFCGICHSDLSMLDNDWGMTSYPLVPGHEVVGTISQVGSAVSHLGPGQRVGLGWMCRSCLVCDQCMSGNHNRCQEVEAGGATIIGRHGGFADHVRCQASWAIPLPEGVDPKSAGPLFCGGLTVFNPFVKNEIKPTQRVGIVGIGGLGHMAVKFANKWGCEVTAFSTSPEKESEARELGAHRFLNSKDAESLKSATGSLDMVLVTVNAPLDWDAYVNTLRPGGKIHIVGALPSVEVSWFPMLMGEKSLGGSPIGSPQTTRDMLEFAGRHSISPIIEEFPMSKVNDAMEKLRSGSPRYRLVLTNDFD
ncbi:NADPH-dependent aldehyde reductase Ahr [Rubripirellula reticaptiva]|uniref:alcohol dehydrogenase (NADP(+)) n=1 Tax=Rubripirellula reticaptiva TaxID=2528013 RepID=A0A5C6ECT2_9BACT|nr:NAD(P)-dependent alcohol dehydrogenase [Rubripirellula reticaptiva]TWU46822.1 Aldehyde reductase Ahr [Rubripirellula reticaptiva]